jgi:predicted  nucleic acid-binding Zn-ribbon protein
LQAARETLERQLAQATNASRDAAARVSELDGQLQQEHQARVRLEQVNADATDAVRAAEERHESALEAAATDRAKLVARFDRELLATAADRDQLTQQLGDTRIALDRAQQDHRSAVADVERLTQREADLTSELANVRNTRDALEHELSEARTALRTATERETSLSEQLDQERTTRTDLEQAMAEAETAMHDAKTSHESALAAAAAHLAAREADFTRELSDIAGERDRLTRELTDTTADRDATRRQYESATADLERLTDGATDLVAQLVDLQTAHDALERQLADATAAMKDAATRHTSLEGEIQQEQTKRADLEQVLSETRAAAFERESRLTIQVAQEQLEHETQLAESEERGRLLVVECDTLRDDLSKVNEQVQRLRKDLAANLEELGARRAESHRLFDQAGVSMFRCTRDGAFTEVNRACAALIGRRTLDEGIDVAAAVFEDPNVLTWLIERCLTTRAKESVETTWRKQDGTRLFMRLTARSCTADVVEVIAEDLTRLRVLEERLARAQRMEAVGRFAQEVAVTCGALLNSIHQKGRDWLLAASDGESRFQGERLFDDVGRAAGLLQELAACGDEQTRQPVQVDLNTLIRDLEPVLKRVAGGDVEVQLRDTSSPLNVDVGTERVERLLVNLASYGRGRMPSGGRLRIELGTSVVDRRFAAKHPNVRLGLHALITVTETGNPTESDEGRAKPAGRPGVDFGTLQELVSECGGHLWMKVQPPGDMVAKIRLPLMSANEPPVSRPATRGARARAAARWFQS